MLSLRLAYGNNRNKPKPPEPIAATAVRGEVNVLIDGGIVMKLFPLKARFMINLATAFGLVLADLTPVTSEAAQPRDISAGYQYTCVVTDAGGVNCFGVNLFGQLGDGSTENSTDTYVRVLDPDDPTGFLHGALEVATGGDLTLWAHTCALMEDGEVKCWGSNGSGQLGNGTTASSNVAVSVESELPMTSVSVGSDATCALTDLLGVQCWGSNGNGQLGDGTTAEYSSIPVDVNVFSDSDVVAVAAGRTSACAVSAEGYVKCWGSNIAGQLGRGFFSGYEIFPTPDFVVDPDNPDSPLSGVVAISTHASRTSYCAVIEDDGVKCWGSDAIFLPNGDTERSAIPVSVSDPEGLLVGTSDIASWNQSGCAIAQDGGVKCWGFNYYGELGDGTTVDYSLVAKNVQLLSNAISISRGSYQACAIGSPYGANCWGKNNFTPYAIISVSNGEPEIIVWNDSINYPVDVIFDLNPPTVTADAEGATGLNQWYTGDVTVTWNIEDDSLTSPISGCENSVISSDTVGITLACTVEDSEGNEGTGSTTIKRDATNPVLWPTASPEPNEYGWNNTDVTVEFDCTDSTSGVWLAPYSPVVLSIEMQGIFAHGSCTDWAGNESGTLYYANIDKTAPTVTLTGVEEGVTYFLGEVPVTQCETSDSLSGALTDAVLSVKGESGDETGAFTATCSGATDLAGNISAEIAVSYMVVTPQQATGFLINDVEALFDLRVLNGRQANSLLDDLQFALELLETSESSTPAIVSLNKFIKEVLALMDIGVLDNEQGQALIDAALVIIAAITP